MSHGYGRRRRKKRLVVPLIVCCTTFVKPVMETESLVLLISGYGRANFSRKSGAEEYTVKSLGDGFAHQNAFLRGGGDDGKR